jgi:hypothetical protein
MENNDLQTIYFFNLHGIHTRPILSASCWMQISYFFCKVSYCNEVSVSITTCHKLRETVSYKYFPVHVFSGVQGNSNLKIIFRGTTIPAKVSLHLLCHRFVKKTQWTPKIWFVIKCSTFCSTSAMYDTMAWHEARTKMHSLQLLWNAKILIFNTDNYKVLVPSFLIFMHYWLTE